MTFILIFLEKNDCNQTFNKRFGYFGETDHPFLSY